MCSGIHPGREIDDLIRFHKICLDCSGFCLYSFLLFPRISLYLSTSYLPTSPLNSLKHVQTYPFKCSEKFAEWTIHRVGCTYVFSYVFLICVYTFPICFLYLSYSFPTVLLHDSCIFLTISGLDAGFEHFRAQMLIRHEHLLIFSTSEVLKPAPRSKYDLFSGCANMTLQNSNQQTEHINHETLKSTWNHKHEWTTIKYMVEKQVCWMKDKFSSVHNILWTHLRCITNSRRY